MDLSQETKKALLISGHFEGSDDWANITGPFDSAGLTCGELGWTMRWNNQDPLVEAFVARHGEARARELMPQKWNEYWQAIQSSDSTGVAIVTRWGHGSTVNEPYRTELRNFWKSPEMIAIQVEFAEKQMGTFAQKWTDQFCAYYNIPFHSKVFAWFFDIAVHNGGMKGVTPAAGNGYAFSSLEQWIKSLYVPMSFHSTKKDLLANLEIWRGKWETMQSWEKALVGMAVARSSLSSTNFKADVMNRKGSIAFGEGIVHGQMYKFDFGDTPVSEGPKTPDRLTVLEGLLQSTGIPGMMAQHFQAFMPELNARYYAIANFQLASNKPRLMIYDLTTQSFEMYLLAHGAGSARRGDAEITALLSNVPGSHCNPPGMLKCGEIENNKLVLRGLESTGPTRNDSTESRGVFLSPLEGVTAANAVSGRDIPCTMGDFGVDPDKFGEISAKLQKGSLLWSLL